MKTIGFATEFYTLWDVESEPKYRQNQQGDVFIEGITTRFTYYQNLSKDLDKAKFRAKELLGFIPELDDSLRGKTASFSSFKKEPMPDHLFEFGKFEGCRIIESTDEWQLMRVYNEDRNPRRRVYARRALINIGSLKRYTWFDGDKRINYATANEIVNYEAKLDDAKIERGHHFNNGERVEISARCTSRFGFDTHYGWTTIQKFVTNDLKEFIYMGSSPCDIYEGDEVDISATIKHDEYNEEPQTKLLRIKILSVAQ